MQERRGAPRLTVDLTVNWETLKSQGRGRVSDLSATGCFVLSGGDVTSRELVRLQITSPQRTVTLWGQVVNVAPEIGFAVHFLIIDDLDQRDLRKLLNDLQVPESA
jgi:hypothetical protein